MTQITHTLHSAKRLRLLACALELLHCESADSAVILIPGSEPPRYVAIGTAATIGKLLEIDELATTKGSGPAADTPEFRKLLVQYAIAVNENMSLAAMDSTRAAIFEYVARIACPAGYITDAQIAAGAAVKCDHGQAIGRNVAIDVFDAMKREGGAV